MKMDKMVSLLCGLVVVVGMLALSGGVHAYGPKPTIPSAWNATLKGHLINFFPFTAKVMQDCDRGRTRLDFTGVNGMDGMKGSLLLVLEEMTGFLFDTEGPLPVCQPFQITPQMFNLLSWSYYNQSTACGSTCWRFVSMDSNEQYVWIFKGMPPLLFSFEVNPQRKGQSSLISVLTDVQVGPQDSTSLSVPAFCRQYQPHHHHHQAQHVSSPSSDHPLLSALLR